MILKRPHNKQREEMNGILFPLSHLSNVGLREQNHFKPHLLTSCCMAWNATRLILVQDLTKHSFHLFKAFIVCSLLMGVHDDLCGEQPLWGMRPAGGLGENSLFPRGYGSWEDRHPNRSPWLFSGNQLHAAPSSTSVRKNMFRKPSILSPQVKKRNLMIDGHTRCWTYRV